MYKELIKYNSKGCETVPHANAAKQIWTVHLFASGNVLHREEP